MTNIKRIFNWFRKKYNNKEYFFVFREYKTKSIIKNELRYKVDSIYPEKIDGELYFIVCRNTPVKEKKEYTSAAMNGDVFTEYKVYLRWAEINGIYLKENSFGNTRYILVNCCSWSYIHFPALFCFWNDSSFFRRSGGGDINNKFFYIKRG